MRWSFGSFTKSALVQLSAVGGTVVSHEHVQGGGGSAVQMHCMVVDQTERDAHVFAYCSNPYNNYGPTVLCSISQVSRSYTLNV